MIDINRVTLAYIFFICISYNLKWFYFTGSFAYADLFLPVLCLLTLKEVDIKFGVGFFLLSGLALLATASSFYAAVAGSFSNISIGYSLRALYFSVLYITLLNSKVSSEDVIKAIALSLLFSLLLCFYIWSTNPRYFGWAESMPMLHVRDSPSGLVVNRNESGLTASLLYGISIYSLAYSRIFSKPMSIFLVVVSSLTVALTFSKGAWLLAVIASFVVGAFKFKVRGLILGGVSLCIAIPFLASAELAFVDAVITRFTGSAETNAYRLAYVVDSVFIGTENLLFGIGPGNYEEYARQNGYVVTIDPHNTYMQTFAELGIFGLFTVVAFYGLNVAQSFINSKSDDGHIVLFMLILMLAADGMQSGLSLSMKILYILAALTMKRLADAPRST